MINKRVLVILFLICAVLGTVIFFGCDQDRLGKAIGVMTSQGASTTIASAPSCSSGLTSSCPGNLICGNCRIITITDNRGNIISTEGSCNPNLLEYPNVLCSTDQNTGRVVCESNIGPSDCSSATQTTTGVTGTTNAQTTTTEEITTTTMSQTTTTVGGGSTQTTGGTSTSSSSSSTLFIDGRCAQTEVGWTSGTRECIQACDDSGCISYACTVTDDSGMYSVGCCSDYTSCGSNADLCQNEQKCGECTPGQKSSKTCGEGACNGNFFCGDDKKWDMENCKKKFGGGLFSSGTIYNLYNINRNNPDIFVDPNNKCVTCNQGDPKDPKPGNFEGENDQKSNNCLNCARGTDINLRSFSESDHDTDEICCLKGVNFNNHNLNVDPSKVQKCNKNQNEKCLKKVNGVNTEYKGCQKRCKIDSVDLECGDNEVCWIFDGVLNDAKCCKLDDRAIIRIGLLTGAITDAKDPYGNIFGPAGKIYCYNKNNPWWTGRDFGRLEQNEEIGEPRSGNLLGYTLQIINSANGFDYWSTSYYRVAKSEEAYNSGLMYKFHRNTTSQFLKPLRYNILYNGLTFNEGDGIFVYRANDSSIENDPSLNITLLQTVKKTCQPEENCLISLDDMSVMIWNGTLSEATEFTITLTNISLTYQFYEYQEASGYISIDEITQTPSLTPQQTSAPSTGGSKPGGGSSGGGGVIPQKITTTTTKITTTTTTTISTTTTTTLKPVVTEVPIQEEPKEIITEHKENLSDIYAKYGWVITIILSVLAIGVLVFTYYMTRRQPPQQGEMFSQSKPINDHYTRLNQDINTLNEEIKKYEQEIRGK